MCVLQASLIDQAAWAIMSQAVQEQKNKLARMQREAESKHRHVESHVLQVCAQEQMSQLSLCDLTVTAC